MDDEVHYGYVGAFVLVLGAVLVAAVLWLATGLGSRRATDPYQAVIQESVAGLNLDAPVKYLGVDVGKVVAIGIDPGHSQQVRLQFRIARGTPILQDSVAVLKTQGLTGIAYVELSGGSAGSPPLVPGPDGAPPTIPFKPSLGARLENVLTNVLGNVNRVSDNLNAVFDADNQAALRHALADAAALAQALAAQKGALAATVADAARTAQRLAQASRQLSPTLAQVASSAQAIEATARSAGAASARAGLAADAAARAAQQLSSETLPELARLMVETSALSVTLRQLGEQTAARPSSLLVGNPAPVPGPGERSLP